MTRFEVNFSMVVGEVSPQRLLACANTPLPPLRALNRRARNARARCRSIPLPLAASLGRRSYQIKYGEQINHDDIYIMM